jgi:hypothetical protein
MNIRITVTNDSGEDKTVSVDIQGMHVADSTPTVPDGYKQFFKWLVYNEITLTSKQLEVARLFYQIGRGGGKSFLLRLMNEYERERG